MENAIPQSKFEPEDFDYPSDESQDYNDTKYDLINEINSDDESQDQKESNTNAPNLNFLDEIEVKKTADDASSIFPLSINTQTEAEKYLIREILKRKAYKKKK